MPAIPAVVRRRAAHDWRRRLPAALAESNRSATLAMALRTRDPRRARFLATQLNAVAVSSVRSRRRMSRAPAATTAADTPEVNQRAQDD